MITSIFPIILCGGAGTRLWPLSTASKPKQFLNLTSEFSLFQETLLRLKSVSNSNMQFENPIVVANVEHANLIEEQLSKIDHTPSAIILEPFGRNTAPAIAIAALHVQSTNPDSIMLVLPADHYISDIDAFGRTLAIAAEAAQTGYITTLGITPTTPQTAYGYIKQGPPISESSLIFQLTQFTEKPSLESAEQYLADGSYFWNSGMFILTSNRVLEEFAVHSPHTLKAATAALPSTMNGRLLHLNAHAFKECPSEPFDTAIMEKTLSGAMVPANIGWSDVGSFEALYEVLETDAAGNHILGNALTHNSKQTLVRSESRLVVALGVKDLIIIETPEAVLVADRSHSQEIKDIVALLAKEPPAKDG